MTERFLIYPLVFIAMLRLVPLLRTDARWHRAQILRCLLILLVAGGTFCWPNLWLVATAWLMFVAWLALPQAAVRRATTLSTGQRWQPAARWLRIAAGLTGGGLGRLYRGQAEAFDALCRNDLPAALAGLDELATQPLPAMLGGLVQFWKLSLLGARRDWLGVRELYERGADWGAWGTATQARLLAARAFAETGAVEQALRSLQFVALSPRTLGPLETQLWLTRVVVAALAGDEAGLEVLLPERKLRGFPQLAAYWRGRCALVRGEQAAAARQLARAFALTNPRNTVWREVISRYLEQAEAGVMPPEIPAVQTPGYTWGQEALALALRQTAPWRALMHLGKPAPVTLGLVVCLAGVFLADVVGHALFQQAEFFQWAGNVPVLVRRGEWWRTVTAIFLHAGVLHLALNGAGLWMFGSAVEKLFGRCRVLVIFLVAGTFGNVMSAWHGTYDVAVGASGGVFALVGAFAVAVYRLQSPLLAEVRQRMLVMLVVMVTADFTIGYLEPLVDELAHAGGFVGGVALAWLLAPRPNPPAGDAGHSSRPGIT